MTESMTQQQGRTVQLPPGMEERSTTTCTAETWAAYDALSERDGWHELSWFFDRDNKPCPPTTPLSRQHIQKERTVDGARVVVFRPHDGRAEREAA
jgi:hypothetical protein